jgi:hypothetical protein
MLTNPLILIAAITGIVAVGLLCVVVPRAFDAYRRYRYRKVFTCLETQDLVEVALKRRAAVFGAVFGRPNVRVKYCSLWPKKKGCGEKCVRENWPAE